jgi:starvation-inducible DNA-binding protein
MKKTITSQLHTVQANTYLLLIKTHNYHWNVKGMHFQSLHLLFEMFYNEYFLGVDAVAEHLRAMDKKALGSTKEFKEHASIKEGDSGLSAKEMLRDLLESEKQQIKELENLIEMAEKADDAATADLATQRVQVHKKHYWMIKTHLD